MEPESKSPAKVPKRKKVIVRRRFVRADYNILENPVFDIDNKSDAKTFAVTKTIRRGNDTISTSWVARSERELPKALDKKILLIFLRLFEEQGFPADGRVHFTFFEVSTHLGTSYTGALNDRIEEAVHRLRAMTIEASNSWFDGELKAFKLDKAQYIQLIADAYFVRSTKDGQLELEKSWVQLGAHIQANVRSGAVKMLNMEVAMSIKSPLALRLFEILSKRRNKASSHNTQLSKLAESIPMKPAAVSRLLQLLEGPHKELIAKGVITDVKITGEGKQKILLYHFPTGENVTLTESEARRIEAYGSDTIAASVDLDESQPLRPEDLDYEMCFFIASLHHMSATKVLQMTVQSQALVQQLYSTEILLPIVSEVKDTLTKNLDWSPEQMLGTYLDRLNVELLKSGPRKAPKAG